MGGEGSMMSANNSLKNNRSLLFKRREKSALGGSYSNLELKDFPKATPEQINAIREKVLKDKERAMEKLIIALLVFFGALFSGLVYLIQ